MSLDRAPNLHLVTPATRRWLAAERRLRLVPAAPPRPKMRTIAADDGILLVNCAVCLHNGFKARHFVTWDKVTVKPAASVDRASGERWLATFHDPNVTDILLSAGLTDHQAAFAFSENAHTEGVDPIERQVICGRMALDDLDDPLMVAAWFVDDPSDWGHHPEGGDVA